jgi:hypothetical protein
MEVNSIACTMQRKNNDEIFEQSLLPLILSGSMFVFMSLSSRRASYPATAPQCRRVDSQR